MSRVLRPRLVVGLLGVVLVAACTVPPPGDGPRSDDRDDVAGLAPGIDPCPAGGGAEGSESVGERPPDLRLPCLGPGEPVVDLADLGGRPALVNVWATWCGPCRKEMPALERAYRRYGGDVLFLGVDTRDDPATAVDFLAEVDATYPQVYDADGALLDDLGVAGLPVTLVLDRSGAIVDQHVGPLDDGAIEDLLRDAVSTPQP